MNTKIFIILRLIDLARSPLYSAKILVAFDYEYV